MTKDKYGMISVKKGIKKIVKPEEEEPTPREETELGARSGSIASSMDGDS